jgi:hypothetical protein
MAEAILNVLSGNSKSVDSAWLDQFTLESATQKYLDILGIRHLQKLNFSSSGTRVSD